MTQQDTKKQQTSPSVRPAGSESNPSDNSMSEVLHHLKTIEQRLALNLLPAIPLDAFLTMLRDELKFDLPLRTAQDMISDGRIPIVPKLRPTDKPWVNLHRWREMTKAPDQYLKFARENSCQRVTPQKSPKRAATRPAV